MTLKGLTKAQVAVLQHIIRRIQRCEGDIPRKHWCPTCHLRLRKIAKLTEVFHRRRRSRTAAKAVLKTATDMCWHWSDRTEPPRYDTRA